MGYVKLPGSLSAPWWGRIVQSLGIATSALLDATGEKLAFCGPVHWNDNATSKQITKIGIRFGSVTKAGGSGLTISLQTVNLATGPPMQPDETQDETVAVANGNAAFATNTWLMSGALSANRTVSRGERIGIVVEFDGGGRLGADSVVISGLASTDTGAYAQTMTVHKTGGTWAQVAILPCVILEFSDGTFGTLAGALPFSATNNHTYKSDSSPNEYALEFQMPVGGKVGGAELWLYTDANTSDFDVILYGSDGSTVLGSVSVDANAALGASFRQLNVVFPDEYVFAANTDYWLAVKPTQSTSNMRIGYIDVSAAGHLDAFFGGQNWHMASRTGTGTAWGSATKVLTRRPLITPVFTSLETGGGPVGTNQRGGFCN